jgi:hypothetical protein
MLWPTAIPTSRAGLVLDAEMRRRGTAHRDPTYSELDPPKHAAMTRNGVNVCPEAWHLQRRGVARNFGGALNLQQGSRAHRDIGSRVDRVRGLERMRRVVLLVVAALFAGLLFQLLTASGPLRP